MRSLATIFLSMLAALSFMTPAVFADVHFKDALTFTDLGLTLQAAGTLTGLGDQDAFITLTATADATTICTNQGGSQMPGQTVTVTVTGDRAQVHKQNVGYESVTNLAAQPTAQQAGCPKGNWTAQITDLTFTSATISVEQGGQIVLSQTVIF
jgi:hypothetical protein